MVQPPTASGLILCEQVIIEEKTRNVSLVNTMGRLHCSTFPSPPQRLVIYAALTNGMGEGTMSLVVSRLDMLEEVDQRRWQMRFTSPLRIVRLMLRPPALSFPAPGQYQYTSFADGEWVAQTILEVTP
jgi:hypothetical protein